MRVYLIRHGKTMFNTIGRAQGWSDTPLTREGEEGIIDLGQALAQGSVKFDRAYSSDSGRTIQTMGHILRESKNEGIPYQMDPRIREWCFGSFDGGYDGELFDGVLPRIFAENLKETENPSYEEIAAAIYQADTAGWAETWTEIRDRILKGFYGLAQESQEAGAKEIVVVSHGMTIGTFLKLIDPDHKRPQLLDNGSVTLLEYRTGEFKVVTVGDMSWRKKGEDLRHAKE